MKRVRIEVDGQSLNGCLIEPDAPAPWPAILFAHGWGGSQRQDLGKARRLTALGIAALTFNFRGHARTRRQLDTVSRADNLRDLGAAWDLLAATPGVDTARMGVVGASYGGYLAVLLTAERPVRVLALQAPAIYRDRDFDRPKLELNLDGQLARYRKRRLAAGDNRVLALAAQFSGHVLLVEPENDTVVPHPVIGNYLRAFRLSATSVVRYVVADADHALGDTRWRREYSAVLVDWLASKLSVPASRRRRPVTVVGGALRAGSGAGR